MNINVVELDQFLAVETIAFEPLYPQHNNVPFNLNHEKWISYCPQSFSGGGLYLKVKWLLWSVYDGLL